MKNLYLPLLLLLTLFAAGCQTDDDDDGGGGVTGDGLGDVFVRVEFNGQSVEGASIVTDPVSIEGVTDETGSVLLKDIPVGSYRFMADRAPLGRGVTGVMVEDNLLKNIDIRLEAGDYITPRLRLYTLNGAFNYDLSEPVELEGSVMDDDEPASFTITLESDLSGVVATTRPGANGVFRFSETLPEGIHQLKVSTEDSDGIEVQTSLPNRISITRQPDAVEFDSVAIVDGQLTLYWQASQEPGFENYEILRQSNNSNFFSTLATINQITTESYVDATAEYGVPYTYKIRVNTNAGGSRDSEFRTGRYILPGIDLQTGIVMLRADHERPYLYGLDRINNNMLFINTDTRSVEKTIFVGSAPADLAFSLDNDLAYIANYGSSQIAVIDLETQEKTRDLIVDVNAASWEGNPYRLTVLNNNRIAWTSEDQWCSISIVNASNGAHLGSGASIYQPGLLSSEDGQILFATESGSTGSQAIRFSFDDNELSEISSSNSSTNFGSRDACLSGDGRYLFYKGAKLLTNNLNTNLGSVNDHILASTDEGDVVVGRRNVWDAETFAIQSVLPFEADLAVIPRGGRTAYIYLDEASQLIVVDLPE